MKFVIRYFDFIFLSFLSLAGIALAFYATSKYGAGLPSDSAWYISVAENFLRGNGLVTFDMHPLNAFPPLFPVIVAALSKIFGADVFIVGWYLDVLLLGVNIFLSGILLRSIFLPRSPYFYLGVLFITFSPSFLQMHTSIFTEPLFVTFMLLSIFIAKAYLKSHSIHLIWLLGILAALSALLRYVGVSLIASGFLIILLAHWLDWPKLLKRGALFGLISGIPFFAWLYFYNYLQFGKLLYPTNPRSPNITMNFLQAIRKIVYWFVPYRPISADGIPEALAFVGVCALLLLVINRKRHWKEWLSYWGEPFPLITLIYAGIYFVAVTVTANTPDHYSLFSDRYYAAIIFFIAIFLFINIEKLVAPHIPTSPKNFAIGLAVLTLLWMFIPVSRIAKYVQQSLEYGEYGYNIYNTRTYHESDVIKYAQEIARENPRANFYSNVPAAVWFLTRQNMLPMPDKYQDWTKEQFVEQMAGWPSDKPGYVFWFESDPFEIFYSPHDLSLISDIEPVQKVSDGVIYYVSKKK